MAKSFKEVLNKRIKKKKKKQRISSKKTREYRMYNAYAREKKRNIKFVNVVFMKHMKRQRLVYYSFLVVDRNEKVDVVVLIDLYEHYHVYIVQMYHIVL